MASVFKDVVRVRSARPGNGMTATRQKNGSEFIAFALKWDRAGRARATRPYNDREDGKQLTSNFAHSLHAWAVHPKSQMKSIATSISSCIPKPFIGRKAKPSAVGLVIRPLSTKFFYATPHSRYKITKSS
jgi:hypothetical protein